MTIWKKELKVEPNWRDKTVLLKHFKLHSYKESLSLSSTFRSEIHLLQDHKFSRYEGKYITADYQSVSVDQASANNEKY